MSSTRRHSGAESRTSRCNEAYYEDESYQEERQRRHSRRSTHSISSKKSARRSSSDWDEAQTLRMQFRESPERPPNYRRPSPPPSYERIYGQLRVSIPEESDEWEPQESCENKVRSPRHHGRRHGRASRSSLGSQSSPCFIQEFSFDEYDTEDTHESPRHGSSRRRRCSERTELRRPHGPSEPPQYLMKWKDEAVEGRINMPVDGIMYEYESLPIPTHKDVQEKLKECGKKKFWNCNSVAKESQISRVVPACVYRYTLKTMLEKRTLEDRTKPYTGENVDDFGLVPEKWEMFVQPPTEFPREEIRERHKVPHTSYVAKCDECHGKGKDQCGKCDRTGKVTCQGCSGTGRDPYGKHAYNYHHHHDICGTCSDCHGEGKTRCEWCKGKREIQCSKCEGKQKLLHYTVLVVSWITLCDTYMDDHPDIKQKKLMEVSGHRVLNERSKLDGMGLDPIQKHQLLNENVRHKSKIFLEAHNSRRAEKRLQQHVVELIPVNTVHYKYHGKQHMIHLLGNERKIYAEEFPKRIECAIM